MTKKYVLDLMKESYSVDLDLQKLKCLFFETPMFQEFMGFSVLRTFTYANMFDGLILREWNFRRTYISVESMLVENGLYIDFQKKYTDEQILNFIEIIDNILAVRPNYEYLKMRSIYIIDNNYKLMLETLRLLIENLGLEETKIKMVGLY